MNTPDFNQREQEKQCDDSKNAKALTTMFARHDTPDYTNSGNERNAEPETDVLTAGIDSK